MERPFSGSFEVSGLMGEFCAVLYKLVRQVLSAIRINGVSAFQGDVCIARIGPIVAKKCPHN